MPDREEAAGVVPLDQLRPDDAGVRPERLFDELADRRRLERHVVVEEAEEAGALDQPQRLVRGRAEARVGLEPADIGGREVGRDPGGEVLVGGDVDHQDREVRVVLGRERGQELVEVGPGCCATTTATTGGAACGWTSTMARG